MWLLTAAFDCDEAEGGPQKTKVLKCGEKYPVGRKNKRLVLKNQKVSSNAGEFMVEALSRDEDASTTSTPLLSFYNERDKPVKIERKGQAVAVNPKVTFELKDGDGVYITVKISIRVKWQPICCYSPAGRLGGKSSAPLEACKSLGIRVVSSLDASVTHHLTPNFTASASIATSLLSNSQFVKPEWLTELIKFSDDEDVSFSIPPISKFRPTFSPSLDDDQKIFKTWEPNEERLKLFKNVRFLCVGEKGREVDSELRGLITAGDGAVEIFNVSDGKVRLRRALSRGSAKEGKTLVVIGSVEVLRLAVGEDGLQELQAELKEYGLNFVPLSRILQAVIRVDVSILSTTMEQSERDAAHKLDPPEPSPPHKEALSQAFQDDPPVPVTRKRPVRRATSREPSLAPSDSSMLTTRIEPSKTSATPTEESRAKPSSTASSMTETPGPKGRKPLTRRVKEGVPILTGIDDPSIVVEAAREAEALKQLQAEGAKTSSNTAPEETQKPATQTKGRSNLKRRVGTTSGSTNVHDATMKSTTDAEEPPFKKYKSFFDSVTESAAAGAGITQTQNDSQSGIGRLNVVREEEEEEEEVGTSSAASTTASGRKRKLAEARSEVDVEMVEGALMLPSTAPVRKKRAVEGFNAVDTGREGGREGHSSNDGQQPATAMDGPLTTTKRTTSGTGGAAPGQHDIDQDFLKALASQKKGKGKSKEDEFDRDFNKLRISKPDPNHPGILEHEDAPEPEEEWKVLADFGTDEGLRGNFMIICEFDVWADSLEGRKKRQEEKERHAGEESVNEMWGDVPNFKKFRSNKRPGAGNQQQARRQGKIIELVSEVRKPYTSSYAVGNPDYRDDLPVDMEDDLSIVGTTPQPTNATPSTLSSTLKEDEHEAENSWNDNRSNSVPSVRPDDSIMDVEEELVPKTRTRRKAPATSAAKTATTRTRNRSVSKTPSSRAGSEVPEPGPSKTTRRTAAPRKAPQKNIALFLSDSEDSRSQSQMNDTGKIEEETFDPSAVVVSDDGDDFEMASQSVAAATAGSNRSRSRSLMPPPATTRSSRSGTQSKAAPVARTRARNVKVARKDSDSEDGAFDGF